MSHILVLRFSALGDVLASVPVVESFARQHPADRVTVCSRPWAEPIFRLLPPNVSFVAADLKGVHHGLPGLMRLAHQLLSLHPTHVADIHDVLRTKVLRARFGLAGLRMEHLHKDRRAQKAFLKSPAENPQTPVCERYQDVFCRLGFTHWTLDFHSLFPSQGASLDGLLTEQEKASFVEPNWVAVAPFATHRGKIYPTEQMEQVIRLLTRRTDLRLFLFGAGAEEKAVLEEWASHYPRTLSMAGRFEGLHQEAALLSHCRVMLSMDSANMHLASLVGVPVVSLWGATHPRAGFLGYGQKEENAVQRTDLPCRPCSIYGQTPCRFDDYRCLAGIAPQTVADKITEFLL